MSASQLSESFTARPSALNEAICPGDRMFKGNAEAYLIAGFSALKNIRLALLAAALPQPRAILDFPSGHGRVLRYLAAEFPEAKLTACDIETSAIEFCQSVFGAVKVQGHEDPWKIPLPDQFDLIWVGSLLTHLGEKRCLEFLQFFCAKLNPQGLLIFTMHGREVAARMTAGTSAFGLDPKGLQRVLKDYRRRGFGYVNYPKKKTFGVSENYGVSLVTPRWIFDAVEKLPGMRLVTYTEKAWDGLQDVIACVRE